MVTPHTRRQHIAHQLLLWVSKSCGKQAASPANSLTMKLSIYLFRRKKNPNSSLLLLFAAFNSGGFLIDRYWLSGRQSARENGREEGRLRKINQQYRGNKNGTETEFKGRGKKKKWQTEREWRETANPRKLYIYLRQHWTMVLFCKINTHKQWEANCDVMFRIPSALHVYMNIICAYVETVPILLCFLS